MSRVRPRGLMLLCAWLASLAILGLQVSGERPVHGAALAGCSDAIQNGGFEDGPVAWQQASSAGYALISTANPHSGYLGAYLGGVNNADDRISQEIYLPAAAVTLRFWWYMSTAETAGSFDHMTATLLMPDGRWLADLATLANTAVPHVWDEAMIDLTPFAGQSAIIQFRARTDDGNVSDFYIDDIAVVACLPEPTLTASATRTATATASATQSTTPTPTATASATQSTTRNTNGDGERHAEHDANTDGDGECHAEHDANTNGDGECHAEHDANTNGDSECDSLCHTRASPATAVTCPSLASKPVASKPVRNEKRREHMDSSGTRISLQAPARRPVAGGCPSCACTPSFRRHGRGRRPESSPL